MAQEATRERKQLRASVALLARYGAPSESEVADGICLNLSRSGMFLGTARPVTVGSLLKIDCELLEADEHIRGVARVIWVRHEAAGENRPAGMGLRFLNLESGSDKLIERILERGDVGNAGRRGRSDPPDAHPSPSPRPKLVSVAPMREVRSSPPPESAEEDRATSPSGSPLPSSSRPPASHSSNPPARRSRDAEELRERLLKTRRYNRADELEMTRAEIAPPPTTPPAPEPEAPRPEKKKGVSKATRREILPRIDEELGEGEDTASRPTQPESFPADEQGSTDSDRAPAREGERSDPPPRDDRPKSRESDRSKRELDRTQMHGSDRPTRDSDRAKARGSERSKPRSSDRPARDSERSKARGSDRPGTKDGAMQRRHDDLERPHDPAWRAQRLAELLAAEQEAMDSETGSPSPLHEEAEEAELGSSPQGRGRRMLLAGVALLLVVGLFAFAVMNKRKASTKQASEGDAPSVVMPAAEPEHEQPGPAPEPGPKPVEATTPTPATPERALPSGVDIPPPPAEDPRAREEREREEQRSRERKERRDRERAERKERAAKDKDKDKVEKPAAEQPPPGPTPPGNEAPAAAAEPPPPAPAAPGPAPAPPPATAGNKSPFERATECLKRGDSACAVEALEGNVRTAKEWELLIESYRANGQSARAESRMRAYLVQFPNGRRAAVYRRMLGPSDPAPEQ